MPVYRLLSDKQFIRTANGSPDIYVYEYMDDPYVFEMIHAGSSRWGSAAIVGPSSAASFKALEVFGVTIGGDLLPELVKDLTLTGPDGQTSHLAVNRQGLCFLSVYSHPIVRLRINDHFGWSKYGVKPEIRAIWSVWDMSSGAVLVAPPTSVGEGREDSERKWADMYEGWKKLLEEKDKLLEEKEKFMEKRFEDKEKKVIALKAVLESLSL